jgi:hypothetical protein
MPLRRVRDTLSEGSRTVRYLAALPRRAGLMGQTVCNLLTLPGHSEVRIMVIYNIANSLGMGYAVRDQSKILTTPFARGSSAANSKAARGLRSFSASLCCWVCGWRPAPLRSSDRSGCTEHPEPLRAQRTPIHITRDFITPLSLVAVGACGMIHRGEESKPTGD